VAEPLAKRRQKILRNLRRLAISTNRMKTM
jgi:hypothetical protein